MDDRNLNEDTNDSGYSDEINFQLVNDKSEDSSPSYFVNRTDDMRSKKRHKKRGLFSYFIVALVAALIGGTISAYVAPTYLYGKIIPLPDIYRSPNTENQINITTKEDITTVTAVAKKSMKSVVGITTVETVRDFIWERQVQGIGSGVIVDSRGYILTNSHVVGDNNADRITVLFEDGDKKVGQVIWHDPSLDLAMVKVNAINLPVADFGDSDTLQIGEIAVAIGNPLGLEFQRTVTSGIISGLNRTIPLDQYNKMEDLIQTDASINPGNSGGPLLNAKGEVIGINTAKISTGEGLGFAIPINIAKPIVKQLIEDGKFVTVYIGIQGTDVSVYEQALGIDLKADYGVYIAEIIANSPAASSGLRPGDVLISIDGKKVETYRSLKKILYNYEPEDKVKATVIRNGENIEVDIVLKESSLNQ